MSTKKKPVKTKSKKPVRKWTFGKGLSKKEQTKIINKVEGK